MSIFTKTILAIALTSTAVLPAAADAVLDRTYAKEQMERYMPDARTTTMQHVHNRGTQVAPQFFLEQRQRAPFNTPAAKYEPAGG